ncbi:MAG TPA: YceI family protein [Polyangiaceae bacterium]|nr:YceI family protein [Polyangiaceae bacterium]
MRKMLAVLPLLFITTLAQAEPVEWSFDASHSKIGFKVQHLVVSNVSGRFREVEKSKIVIDDQNPANSKIEIDIKAASINTDEAKRDEHLKSPDFFDVAKFPLVKFASTKIVKAGKGYKVTGNLTIRDVTKEVVLTTTLSQPIKNPWGKQVRAATLTGTINRGDFGLKWNKALEAGGVVVGDKVTLEIDAEVTH